jgi:hypothetical protein
MSELKKFKLTKEQVNFLKVAGVGLGGYLIYKALKKVGKSVKDVFGDYSDEQELVENINSEQKELKKKGMTLSYSLYTYKSDAEVLLNAMGRIGTDEDAIYRVFSKMNNDLDVSELFKQFGTHLYAVSPVNFQYLDLNGWISEELNSKEIAKLNQILASNNITYRF